MDQEEDLPGLFRKYGVFVLPVDRRSYAIVRGQGYHKPEEMWSTQPLVHEATLPITLVEMAEKGPRNEGLYLEYAYNTGLLERFLGVKPLYGYFGGRTTTPQFSFHIGMTQLQINGAQIEMDQTYVDGGQIIIAEAKVGVPKSFIIRQLYYPYRAFKIREPNRLVRTFLFAYDDRGKLSYLWEYAFNNPLRYDSILLVKSDRFTFRIKAPEAQQFAKHGDLTKVVPQADDLAKIIELPIQVHLGSADSEKIARHFHFTKRQSSYYRQATEGLGLVELRGRKYELTRTGHRFVGLSVPERNRAMTELLFRHPIVQETLKALLSNQDAPVSKANIEKIISESSRLTRTTLARRAQTILAWFRWIQRNFGLVVVSGDHIWLASRFPSLNGFAN